MSVCIEKLLVLLLLGRSDRYFKVLRIGTRNVQVNIEPYIPGHEWLKTAKDKVK